MIESCEPNELFELGLPDLRRYGDVQAEARHAHECEIWGEASATSFRLNS
jgi:hypothetical protein